MNAIHVPLYDTRMPKLINEYSCCISWLLRAHAPAAPTCSLIRFEIQQPTEAGRCSLQLLVQIVPGIPYFV